MLSFVVALHLRTLLCEDRDFGINLAHNLYLTTSKGQFAPKNICNQKRYIAQHVILTGFSCVVGVEIVM